MKPPVAPARYVGPGLLVTADMDRMEARRALANAGFKFLAGGSFAGVVISPGGDRVVRVAKPDRGGWVAYQAFMSTFRDEEHTPRVYGMLELADGGFVAEVERLYPPPLDETPPDIPYGLLHTLRSMAKIHELTLDLDSAGPYNWTVRRPANTLVASDPFADSRQHWHRDKSDVGRDGFHVEYPEMVDPEVPIETIN